MGSLALCKVTAERMVVPWASKCKLIRVCYHHTLMSFQTVFHLSSLSCPLSFRVCKTHNRSLVVFKNLGTIGICRREDFCLCLSVCCAPARTCMFVCALDYNGVHVTTRCCLRGQGRYCLVILSLNSFLSKRIFPRPTGHRRLLVTATVWE